MKRILALLLALFLVVNFMFMAPGAAAQETGISTEVQSSQLTAEPEQAPSPGMTDDIIADGHVMRLPEEEGDDLYKLVFLNEDGSRTMYLYDHPVKYMESDGTIRDISLDIADGNTPQAAFVTANNAAVTSFSQKLSDGISLSGNGTNLRLIPILPALDDTLSTTEEATAQRLDSKTIEYRYDANTTFEYSLTYTGFKEDIVVSQYTGQTEYAFFLYTDGLSVTQLQDSWYLTDDTGAVRAAIGDIVVFTADERNNTMGRMESETIKENEIYLLTIVLDADYLADPNTAYPIRIDPTVDIIFEQSGASAIEDVTIYSNATSQGEYTASVVGKTSNGIARLLMRFPNFDFSALEGATVTYARVTPRDILCEGTEMTVTCYPFTGSAWTESTAQWSNLTQSWDASMGVGLPISYSKGLEQPTDHWYRFEITDLVQKWIDGEADPALGIIFKADSTVENGSAYLHKTFGSYERSGYKPWFTMTYVLDLQLNYAVKDIDEGGSFTLTATTSDGPATNVTWTSSNTAVATVDANGVVTAHKAGVATITATSPDAIRSQSCYVYVNLLDGYYYLRNAHSFYAGTETAPSAGSNIYLNIKKTSDNPQLFQLWYVRRMARQLYEIRPATASDLWLRAENGTAGISSLNQRWHIYYNNGGYVLLGGASQNNALTYHQPGAYPGLVLETAQLTSSSAFRWQIEKPVGLLIMKIYDGSLVKMPCFLEMQVGVQSNLEDFGYLLLNMCNGGDTVTFVSDEAGVAEADNNGEIIAKKVGTTKIRILSGTSFFDFNISVIPFVMYSYPRKPGVEEDGTIARDMHISDLSKQDLLEINISLGSLAGRYDLPRESSSVLPPQGPEALEQYVLQLPALFASGDAQMRAVAYDMFEHFLSGAGTEFSDDVLTQRVHEHTNTAMFVGNTEETIQIYLAEANFSLPELVNNMEFESTMNNIALPNYNLSGDYTNGLKICLNGIWGYRIDALEYTISDGQYMIRLQYTLYDHFGLDTSDVTESSIYSEFLGYTAQFGSWFVLQRYVNTEYRYRPFVTFVVFEETIIGMTEG